MSDVIIDQEFFSAARRGFKSLSEDQKELLKKAVENSILENGSFANENGETDLYQSSFGIQLCTIMGIDKNKDVMTEYLRSFKDATGLDFLHVVSLARAWRFYSHDSLDVGLYSRIAEKVEYNRCSDGAWNQAAGTHYGSVYGTVLAIAAYQNLDQTIPEELKVIKALRGLRSADGAFGTDHGGQNGTTPSTAFAAIILNFLEENTDFCLTWLEKQQHSDGGFLAVSQMPFSDIQSTVYAMAAFNMSSKEKFDKIAEDGRRFILSMLQEKGFAGHCKDTVPTMENTFLGLVGLGLN